MYLGDDERLDKHHDAACDYGCKSDDIESAEDIEDYVAWAGQMFC